MYIDVSQRFTQVVNFLLESHNLKNQAQLAQILSLSKGYVSQLVNGQREPSSEVVSKLANSFPIINEDWLFTGVGDMLKNHNQPENPVEEQPKERTMVDRLFSIVESQKKDIETLIQLVKEKDDKIEELLDELNTRKGGSAQSAASSSDADAI